MSITRRSLLFGGLALGAGLALGPAPEPAAAATGHEADRVSDAEHPAVLYDLSMCAGCHLCEIACQVNKGLPPEKALLTFRSYERADGTTDTWAIRRNQCMHCLEPACASICPVAALQKSPDGPVIYEDERCMGCRYCQNACPFGIPEFDWDSGVLDKALIRKCDFCAERQAEGKLPACVEACPTGAVKFGKRQELLDEARARMAKHPDRYVNHIYGEHEVGGTSFLLLSGTDFDKLGLPMKGGSPPQKVSQAIVGATIPFALSWAAVLTGITGVSRLKTRTSSKEGKTNGHHHG